MISIFVRLHVADFSAFEEFERSALKIAQRYGGRLISAFEVKRSGNSGEEIHILEFPDQKNFDSYRLDPDLKKLSKLRAKAISKTEIEQSISVKHYN